MIPSQNVFYPDQIFSWILWTQCEYYNDMKQSDPFVICSCLFRRLYKEEFPKGYSEKKRQKEILKQLKKKKKKEKKKKKKKKSSKGDVHSASSAEEDEAVEQPLQSTWSVACLTLQDWEDLTEKYKNSKKKSEKDLYETLSESFLPEIVKMFAEKEKDERRKMLFMQPKRASSRIERKKQEQDERDRVFAEKVS